MAQPSEEQIQEQIDKAVDHDPRLWAGMTYEQGVVDALQWVLDDAAPGPLDDEDPL